MGILFYLGVTTLIGDATIVGSYGEAFALANVHVFGYVAYTFLFLLMVPLFYWYKGAHDLKRRLEMGGVFTLLFFALIFFQALVVEGDYRGSAGALFADVLGSYIGTLGLWIFWFVLVAISIVLVLEQSVSDLFVPVKNFMDQPLTKNIPDSKIITEMNQNVEEEAYPIPEPLVQNEIIESKSTYVPPEMPVMDAAEDMPSAQMQINEVQPTPHVDQPAEVIEKESTILSMAKKVKEAKHALVVEELEENKMLLDQIDRGESEKPKNFKLPPIDFFQAAPKQQHGVNEDELDDKIRDLIDKLGHFNIDGDVVRTYAGPVVSTFEFKPAANIKVSKILNLQDDLAMALRAQTIRIQAPIPGKDVVGIEIPNKTVETIYIREIFESKLFKEAASPLTLVLGKDIVGKPFITDLKKLPHLLIAGTTGSGKSVGINAMILSLLYKNSPDQLKLMMIDPKMLEFSIYNDIPHLLTPVITKPKEAISALNNMVYEMERRYQMMSETRTKNIENYNEKAKKEKRDTLPYIVVIIDELADLMMTSGKDVEYSIARLAQMARASGIHLIVATQRPSVDVVTGLIKANLPSRISYKVGQKIDSKIILDGMGAESLLGRGDMLFTPPGMSGLVRLHAPWSTETEIEKVVDFLKDQREPEYDRKFLRERDDDAKGGSSASSADEPLDELYEEAKSIVLTEQKTSISYLQRRLQIGYNRSARLIEQLEQQGILSAPNAKGNRDIVIDDPF